MTNEIDTYTLRHLDAWLDREIGGDTMRAKVRAAMVAFISDDPEYWGSQSWWNVYDRARCDRIRSLTSISNGRDAMTYAPKQINPDSAFHDLLNAGAAWQFSTENFTVAFFAEPEELDPADSFSEQEDVEFAQSGRDGAWFCAVVAVYGPTGDRIAMDVLGGCSYNTTEEFYTSHRSHADYARNTLKNRARGVSYGHYFPDMVRQVIGEARGHMLKSKEIHIRHSL